MNIEPGRYLDQVYGGWLGKCIGGAIGARFEGTKGTIEIAASAMFPKEIPPNDDLDLQVLWLKVLEEKGAALTADDLAAAWLEHCWYPFNEYGIFRRNWRLGIHPPESGRFGNEYYETGMGCPIRSEIWGYVFPGAPETAAAYAALDGSLDHTRQSVGAEQMLAAMASMAFCEKDLARLAERFMGYLPGDSPVLRMTREAFGAYAQGLDLKAARDRVMFCAGTFEACDAMVNVPFTFLGLLYGGGDMERTLLSALYCGYDTDCTCATAAAFVGQMLGASRIPKGIKDPVGDALVMGIKYRRKEMTISALARDTVRRAGTLSREKAPSQPCRPALSVEYSPRPSAAPGEEVQVALGFKDAVPAGAEVCIDCPPGWTAARAGGPEPVKDPGHSFVLRAGEEGKIWPMRNIFKVRTGKGPVGEFGVAGAGTWRLLDVFYDPLDKPLYAAKGAFKLGQQYLKEPDPADAPKRYARMSQVLGRPALLATYSHEVDPARLIGYQGPFCAYLDRTVVSPSERDVYFQVGNNDSYRLYLNGALMGEAEEYAWWAPANGIHKGRLLKGPNRLFLKLLKRGNFLKFTLGIRAATGHPGGANCEDWLVDLADAVPAL